jgi:transposase-like protein
VIRKSIKTRGSFPIDEAATKLIYLAIRNFEKDGGNVREWFAARNQFAIMDLSRFRAAPIAHLCSLCFEGQGAFPAEC